MFKPMSNIAFNNAAFKLVTMPAMHDTMVRLYDAAKQLRNVAGPSAVAHLLNESPQTIKNWETRGISRGGLIKAAQAVGCNLSWLDEGIGSMAAVGAAEPLPPIYGTSNGVFNVDTTPQGKRVPLISWVRAGQWSEIQDEFAPGEADDWVYAYDSRPNGHAFALRVTGDSMTTPYPGDRSFPDGTIIIVDPGQAANAGDYVIAKDIDTQQATFKRLVYDGGRWFLRPLNPAFPTIEIDDPAIRVIGKVIEYQTRGKL